MASGFIFVNKHLSIPIHEIEWRFSSSGGPGGQHANTSNTRVEALFSIVDSPSLTDTQREVLLIKLGDRLRIVASDERSQLQNRELAMDRLAERLRSALVVQRRRSATRPTRGSVERRLSIKRATSEQKRLRRSKGDD